jgi:hypothetical protein
MLRDNFVYFALLLVVASGNIEDIVHSILSTEQGFTVLAISSLLAANIEPPELSSWHEKTAINNHHIFPTGTKEVSAEA